MTNLPQRETPCPTCQQMKETVSATYQTWLARPFDPLYNEAHNASVLAYLRHRLGEHSGTLAEKEKRT